MKYKVTHDYVDKYTKEFKPKGTVVDITKDRAKELEGFVEKVTEPVAFAEDTVNKLP